MSDNANKRKRNYYAPSSKRKQFVLEAGIKGFMCSCNNREKECVRESYNILNAYADKMQEEKSSLEKVEEKEEEESGEILDDLAKEVQSLKDAEKEEGSKGKRFQVVESGAKNVIFIRSTVEDPVKLATSIIEDIFETKTQKTRFLIRLVPIEIVCKANMEEIKKVTATLIDKYFSGDPQTFSIAFNHRNNNQVKRDIVIKELAAMIAEKNEKHSVNLKESALTLVVEIIRGFALLAVVPNFTKYKKYNLINICGGQEVEEDSENVKSSENVKEEAEAKDIKTEACGGEESSDD